MRKDGVEGLMKNESHHPAAPKTELREPGEGFAAWWEADNDQGGSRSASLLLYVETIAKQAYMQGRRDEARSAPNPSEGVGEGGLRPSDGGQGG